MIGAKYTTHLDGISLQIHSSGIIFYLNCPAISPLAPQDPAGDTGRFVVKSVEYIVV